MSFASQTFYSNGQQDDNLASTVRNGQAPLYDSARQPQLTVHFDFNVDPQSEVIPMMDENEDQTANALTDQSNETPCPFYRVPGNRVEHVLTGSNSQKATIFAQKFKELYERLSSKRPEGVPTFCILPRLTAVLEQLLEEQQQCVLSNSPAHIDIAYHYTPGQHFRSISTHGLLQTRDRSSRNIRSKCFHGATMGDGIYTADNPFAFHGKYGNLCVMVARLKGRTLQFTSTGTFSDLVNSLWSGRNHTVQVSTRKSTHVVPLICFNADMVDPEHDSTQGNEMIYAYHYHFQKLLDRCLNGVKSTIVDFPRASVVYQQRFGSLPWSKRVCSVCNEENHSWGVSNVPNTSYNGLSPCLYNAGNKCTKCSAPMTPHARMMVGEVQDVCCEGSYTATSICIKYTVSLYSNQEEADDHADIFAWLPNNSRGVHLLGRLQIAFLLGLTFNVSVNGSSRKCTVSWGPIPHKMRPSGGGMFGFPDDDYIDHCNKVLGNHSIPYSF